MDEENNDLNNPEEENQENQENENGETPPPEETPITSSAPVTKPASEPEPVQSIDDEDEEEDEDEEGMATVKSVSLKWGIILGIVSIALFILGVATDLTTESWFSWFGILPLIIIMVLAHMEFKNDGNSYMSYSQGLGIGILVSLVSGFISGLFQVLYTTVIDPEFSEKLMEKLEDQWAEQGLSDQAIETARGLFENFQNPWIGFFTGLAAAAFAGFIVSLIVSAITKNANPQMEE